MMRFHGLGRPASAAFAVLLGGLSLAGCFSSAPPASAPRVFDPLPAARPAAASMLSPDELRVTANAAYGVDFAVRTSAREVVFDATNRWLTEPSRLLAVAVARRLRHPVDPGTLVLDLEVFELDVVGEPTARVVVTARRGERHTVATHATAARDRSPEALAEAMAAALGAAADAIDAWVADLPSLR